MPKQQESAAHQGFAVFVDEVLWGFGPFGQNYIIYPFFGDLQATQIEAWATRTKHVEMRLVQEKGKHGSENESETYVCTVVVGECNFPEA